MSMPRCCKAEEQGYAMNQAVLRACMYAEVGHGLWAVGNGGCILHEHSCCGDVTTLCSPGKIEPL
jgi:hypothetical protein